MSDAKGSAAYVEAIEQLKKLCGDDYKPRDVVIDEVAALQADNARLRALVKRAEGSAELGHWEEGGCPWCAASLSPAKNGSPRYGSHAADCPAFTADGVVK